MSKPARATSPLLEYILTHHRGLFATLCLLPVSCLYSSYVFVRNHLLFHLRSAPQRHEERVQSVIAQIKAWQTEGALEKLCTARSGWQTMSEMVPRYKLSRRNIRIALHDVLNIDEAGRTVRVEPLVSMGQLSRTLIAKGWILPVVPELDDLTVGGLIMGFGVETSSHRHGLFQSICTALEIVTAEGKRIRCTPTENKELFYLLPWSHGTLGFLVAAELRIIPARQFVRVHYLPHRSLDSLIDCFERACRTPEETDYVEALTYSLDTGVVMIGTLTDTPAADGPINPIGRWYKPWFYKHVEQILAENREVVEYLPLRDYLHRHTRSYFWAMEEIIPFGNHPLFRAALGWALPPRIELLKYTETETTRRLREKHHVVQDMLMPMAHLRTSLQYFDNHFDLYPLWLSPMAIFDNPDHLGLVHPYRNARGELDPLYVDIGAYGTPKKPGFDGRDALPQLEQFVIKNQGYQALYAKTLLSETDFRRMFDHTAYDALRERLPFCKQAFGEIYDKVSSKARISPVEMRRLKAGEATEIDFSND